MTRTEHNSRRRRESLGKRLGRTAQRICKRDGYRCVWCGATCGPMHLDHVMPRSLGGLDHATNLVVACASCNCARRNKPVRQWLAYLRDAYGWTHAQTTKAARRARRHLVAPLPE